MLKQLVYANRSCRRFQEQRRLTREELLSLIDLARCTASHRNAQELRFCPLWRQEDCEAVFPHIGFAAALGEQGRPREGQRPAAYIFILGQSREENFLWADAGMACQSMLLGASERGLAGCTLGALRREAIRPVLGLDEDDPPLLLGLALGWPDERFVIEPATPGMSLKYWREGPVHHVPKLALEDVLLEKS